MTALKQVVLDLLSDSKDIHSATGLKGQHVIVRVDFNVPGVRRQKLLNYARLEQSLPTIKFLQKEKARVVLLSHLGRPTPDSMDEREMKLQFSLSILTSKLQSEIG